MNKVSFLVKNTIIITAASLLLRSVGLFFQTHLTGILGAEGIGLFQLVMSVQALAITAATSGIRFSVTRLISEELGAGRRGINAVMRRAFAYALGFSLLSTVAVLIFADQISLLAGDMRIARSLRLLAPGLPFLSLGSVISGYFTAIGRPWKASATQIFEQLSGFTLIFILLPSVADKGIAVSCSVVALCLSASDLLSFVFAEVLYIFDRETEKKPVQKFHGMTARLLKISLPLALSSYARTALSTLQHLMVPSALKRSGASSSEALSVYGTIHGMVFPVLAFPQAFFYSLAELIIPELTQAQVQGKKEKASAMAGGILSFTLLFSIFVAAIFFFFGEGLGAVLYKGENAGEYIRLFAPLVIVMYMDTITDGMLKGLGMQLDSMYINISDALLCLLFVRTLLPIYAVRAYIAIIFFSECFNFVLSFRRLSKTVDIRLGLLFGIRSVVSVLRSK